MAKTKTHHSTALALHRAPRAAAPIIVRVREPGTSRRKGKGHHKGGKRLSTEKTLMGLVMGGLALGFIDKPGSLPVAIPTVPILGKAGTIAVIAHFVGKGRAGIATDIRNAAAVVASYEFGSKGSVSGDEI